MDTASSRAYCPIADYGIIGDMHTCALVNKTGSIDFMCWPVFDSPSLFCRLLDKDKGGYFSIRPTPGSETTCNQKYLPYTNMLNTKWIHENGVAEVLDYFPVSGNGQPSTEDGHVQSDWCHCNDPENGQTQARRCQSCIIRKVACARGTIDMQIELFPAFNYARNSHRVVSPKQRLTGCESQTITFQSGSERLYVDIHVRNKDDGEHKPPMLQLELEDKQGYKGCGLCAKSTMSMGQSVTLVLRGTGTTSGPDDVGLYLNRLEQDTFDFWTGWTRRCTFRGHYREQVERSLLVLKLLTYKPTGAIIASPTFSLPESVGNSRNWDYRYSWIRDTTFTLYVFLENGYSDEAESYMRFIYDRIIPSISCKAAEAGKEQLMPIVLTIRGENDIPETELSHLDGYRGSRPVRIGNGATSHTQLDTFGALLDSIYLYNKFAGPISYDRWVEIRRIVNHVIQLRNMPDMSIWEVRGEKQNFVFSKIMLWVTVDRALRLSEKRSNLPCPDRASWLSIRDEIYEEIMQKGYNSEKGFFCMSYERRDVLDASVLIAPLVLFIAPDDPRSISTIRKVMEPREKGGLTSAKMVFRYDHRKAHDGELFFLYPTLQASRALNCYLGKFDLDVHFVPHSHSRLSTQFAHPHGSQDSRDKRVLLSWSHFG